MKTIRDHKDGFALIEAVIAITIIGVILTSLYALQEALLKYDFLSNDQVHRILLLKNVFYDPSVMRENPGEELKKEIQIQQPKTKITIKKISFKNKNLKDIKTLNLIRTQASWESIFGNELLEASILVFEEPKKEKKKT